MSTGYLNIKKDWFLECFNDYIHWCETCDNCNNVQVTSALFKVFNESEENLGEV